MFCLSFAVLGLLSSLGISKPPPSPVPQKEKFSWEFIRVLKNDLYLVAAVLGTAFFLMVGAFVKLYLIPYGGEVLGLSAEDSSFAFLFVAVGIGAGSLAAGKLSGRNVEFGIVPVGAAGLALSNFALGFLPLNEQGFWLVLFFAGLSAGLFIIPLQAFIQQRTPRHVMGKVLSLSSFLSFTGVLIASGLIYLFGSVWEWPARWGYIFIGSLTCVLSGITLYMLPDFFLRFVLLVFARTFYKIRVIGGEKVPSEGGGLILCNHVSWMDAVLLSTTTQRRVRFLMSRRMHESKWWIKKLTTFFKVIPVQSGETREQIKESLNAAREAMDEGYLVCIFPEGRLTRSGMMMQFRSGFERVIKDSDYPIIPAYIGGAWGSISTYAYGKVWSQRPKKIPYPITLVFGDALPATTDAFTVRQEILELSTQYFVDRKRVRRSLPQAFLKCAREHWNDRAVSDLSGKKLDYGTLAALSVALSDKVCGMSAKGENVGILLPPSVGGAATNIAVSMAGRVGVNLNYTAGAEAFSSAVKQCEMKSVITARAFVERFKDLELPEQVIYIEDWIKGLSSSEKAWGWLRARLMPTAWIPAEKGFDPDDTATIIFSSGSTAEPKGVMLTHHNLLSNIESLRSVFRVSPKDNIAAPLPLFHSFGFNCTLWFPLVSGFSASYHVNPLEARKIGTLVEENKSTLMVCTPTFLGAYTRKVPEEQFASLRAVIVGAEKLREETAQSFKEKFGADCLQGYGATELSPLATVSINHVQMDGVYQKGWKEGSVGPAAPGIVIKIVDVESGDPVRPGQEGLLLVKGPNVMKGYLGQPEKTAEVIQDGWYNTGDIAIMDREGFITITDRLSRFSKLGGEMVSHLAVEEGLLALVESEEKVLAVTAVPDEKKGERLAVLVTPEAGPIDELVAKMKDSDMPNLLKPNARMFFEVEELPLLGTGKLDLKWLKSIAAEQINEGG